MLARLNCQSTLQQSLVDRRQPSVRKLLNGAGKKSYVPAYGKSAVLTHGAAKRASKPRAACALTRRRPRESEVRPCAMQNLSEEQDMTAVIVVDHGSRREASNKMLFDFVDMYRYCGSSDQCTERSSAVQNRLSLTLRVQA